jgi:hypothetical protein
MVMAMVMAMMMRNNRRNKNTHYIHVGCEILYPPARNRGRTKNESAPKPKMPLLNQVKFRF